MLGQINREDAVMCRQETGHRIEVAAIASPAMNEHQGGPSRRAAGRVSNRRVMRALNFEVLHRSDRSRHEGLLSNIK